MHGGHRHGVFELDGLIFPLERPEELVGCSRDGHGREAEEGQRQRERGDASGGSAVARAPEGLSQDRPSSELPRPVAGMALVGI